MILSPQILSQAKAELAENGFTIFTDVFDYDILQSFAKTIEQASTTNSNFRRTNDLFAIRNLLQEVPALSDLLWTTSFNQFLNMLIGYGNDCVKGIYFDKPAQSNWVVPYHQDLQISVDRREQVARWINWNQRHGRWSVQPSHYYLNYLYTVRIHLDECNEKNGALKVVPGSHKLGILPDATMQELDKTKAVICTVPKGGILVMRPLLVHTSGKSTSEANRRVIHLEFTDRKLPKGLQWREFTTRQNKLDYANQLFSKTKA